MEWVALIVLVPAIVVPLVLLFGFAGCGATLGTYPAEPIITSVKLLDGPVEVSWEYADEPATFKVVRSKGTAETTTFDSIAASPFVDTTAQPETHYTYRVTARSPSDGREFRSDEAAIATLRRAFTSALEQVGFDADEARACVVQRLDASLLGDPCNVFVVSVRSASNADLTLSRITISLPSAVGNDFDSAATPIVVSANAVTVSAGTVHRFVPTPLVREADHGLLVAFDIGEPGNVRFAAGTPTTAFLKRPPAGTMFAIQEAATQNRAGFTALAGQLWLIDSIDVGTEYSRAM